MDFGSYPQLDKSGMVGVSTLQQLPTTIGSVSEDEDATPLVSPRSAKDGRQNRLRNDGLIRPRPDRFGLSDPGFERAMAAHSHAVAEGSAGYIDPTSGLFVMTSQYLADRAWCCDQGCRHCPYAPILGDQPAP